MKKLFILAIAFGAFSLTSCKKDYTCTCKIDNETMSYTYKGQKKADAKKACDSQNTAAALLDGSCSLK